MYKILNNKIKYINFNKMNKLNAIRLCISDKSNQNITNHFIKRFINTESII